MRRSLDLTLEFIATLDAAPDDRAVCERLLAIAQQFGFERLLAGTIPLPGVPEAQHHGHVILDYWPAEWSQRYFSGGYLRQDPAIRQVIASDRPFRWSDLRPTWSNDPAGARVMQEAADFRLADGFTVPLHPIEGGVIGFSLAGERVEMPPGSAGTLTLLTNYAMARALLMGRKPRPQITPRQIEILRWVAAGKTTWEIGCILSIAENTVINHLRAMRERFGVNRTSQMVAEAIRHRFIT